MTQDTRLRTQISKLVSRIILESTGRTLELDTDDPLISSGYLDSMSMVQLVIAVQSELDVELEVTHMSAENFETIQAITALVEARRASAPGTDA